MTKNKLMKKLIIFALLSICACSHHPNHYEVKLQDGTPGYRIDCDKNEFTNQECTEEAFRLCNGSNVEIWGGSNNGSYTIVRCVLKNR